MAEVNDAYEILKDEAKRSQYDRQQQLFDCPPSPPEPKPWSGPSAWQATQEVHLLNLYQQALSAFRDMKWQDALNTFGQIQRIRPTYRDVAGRVEKIHQILAHEKQQAYLAQSYQEGLACLQAEQWSEAIATFEAILDLDSHYQDVALRLKEAQAAQGLAQLYTEALEFIKQEKWSEAIVHLETILTQTPYYRQAAQYLQLAQDYDQKIQISQTYALTSHIRSQAARRESLQPAKTLPQAEGLSPDMAFSEPTIAVAETNLSPTKVEIPPVEMVDVAPPVEVKEPPADETMPADLLAQGLALYARQEFDQARQKFAAALYFDSDDADAHACLAWVYLKEGLTQAAVDHCQTAFRLNARCAHAYVGHGNICQAQGHLSEAGQAYQQALEIEPTWAWVRHKLARLYTDQGLYNEAIQEYQTLIAASPEAQETAQIYHRLGHLFVQQEKIAEATEAYWTAVKLDPQLAHPLAALGQLYEQRGLKHRAQMAYRRFLKTSQRVQETQKRRWAMWRLGTALIWPLHHWLWCTLIWFPLLVTGAFYGSPQEIQFADTQFSQLYLNIALVIALVAGWLSLIGVAYVIKSDQTQAVWSQLLNNPRQVAKNLSNLDHHATQPSEAITFVMYGAIYAGSAFAGLLLAFVFSINTITWPIVLTSLTMLLMTTKILSEERHLAYQLSLGVALGLVFGCLIQASLGYADGLLERFGWAVIFLTFGSGAIALLVLVFISGYQWLTDFVVGRMSD